jgi:hypothetical protein
MAGVTYLSVKKSGWASRARFFSRFFSRFFFSGVGLHNRFVDDGAHLCAGTMDRVSLCKHPIVRLQIICRSPRQHDRVSVEQALDCSDCAPGWQQCRRGSHSIRQQHAD